MGGRWHFLLKWSLFMWHVNFRGGIVTASCVTKLLGAFIWYQVWVINWDRIIHKSARPPFISEDAMVIKHEISPFSSIAIWIVVGHIRIDCTDRFSNPPVTLPMLSSSPWNFGEKQRKLRHFFLVPRPQKTQRFNPGKKGTHGKHLEDDRWTAWHCSTHGKMSNLDGRRIGDWSMRLSNLDQVLRYEDVPGR